MVVGTKGNVINDITEIAQSVYANEYVAFQDTDGAIFQIKKTDVTKLYNYIQQPFSQKKKEPLTIELDPIFTSTT